MEDPNPKVSGTGIYELKKQGNQHEKELENLNLQKRPLVHQAEKDKNELQKELNKRLKELDQVKNRKIAEAEKTSDSTIKTFFKKELLTLEKKQKSMSLKSKESNSTTGNFSSR